MGVGLHGAVCGFNGAGCGGCAVVLLWQDAEAVDEGFCVASDGGVDLGSGEALLWWNDIMMGWFPFVCEKHLFLLSFYFFRFYLDSSLSVILLSS